MKIQFRASAVILSLIFAQTACGQGHTQGGAVLGGLAGAGIGAAIGDNNDDAGAGALIGGAVGVVAGSLLGNARDQQSRYQAQMYQQQQAYQMSRAVSVPDVVSLTHNRLSEGVIINLVRSNGLQRPLEISDIVYLSQQGVSENVIRAMQDVGNGGPAYGPAPVIYQQTPPVVVSRVQVVPAPVYVPRPGFSVYYSNGGGYHNHHHRHCW